MDGLVDDSSPRRPSATLARDPWSGTQLVVEAIDPPRSGWTASAVDEHPTRSSTLEREE
jgi:hypothetical protein